MFSFEAWAHTSTVCLFSSHFVNLTFQSWILRWTFLHNKVRGLRKWNGARSYWRYRPDLNTLHVPTLWNTQLSTHLIGSFRTKVHFNFITTTANPFNYCLKVHSSFIHPIFHNKRSTSRLLNSVWVTKKHIMERNSTSLRAIVLLYSCNAILLDCQCKAILSRALPVSVQEKFWFVKRDSWVIFAYSSALKTCFRGLSNSYHLLQF